jgi:hypothetical protein
LIFLMNPEETPMKLSTIALAGALAMSSSFALAQAGGANSGAAVPETSGAPVNPQGGAVDNGSMDHRTTGMSAREPREIGNPNRPDGPTSLSGSGPSTYGGNSPAVVK